jgi:hypothetical protein
MMQFDLRILFISADFIIPQVLKLYKAEFLRKPFTRSTLIAKVNKLSSQPEIPDRNPW